MKFINYFISKKNQSIFFAICVLISMLAQPVQVFAEWGDVSLGSFNSSQSSWSDVPLNAFNNQATVPLNPYTGYYDTSCVGCSTTGGAIQNLGNFTTVECVGCTTSADLFSTSGCVGCNTTSVGYPNTSSWGLTSYVTTPVSYNTPSHSWNIPSHSNTNFSWTTPNFGGNTCNTSAGYYSSGSSCILYCQNTGNYVSYPNQCPNPIPPTQVCENGYTRTSDGRCSIQCANGTMAVFPNYCPSYSPVCPLNADWFFSGLAMPNGTNKCHCPVSSHEISVSQSTWKCVPDTTPPVPSQCDNTNGYYYNGSSCIKQCPNSSSVIYPNQCAPDVPTPRACNSDGGYFLSNNTCIKNCPNGGAVTQPNQCPVIPPSTTCDNANGYYYNLATCVKFCVSTNSYVTYPNQCPNYNPQPTPQPTPIAQCDNANGYYYNLSSCVKYCSSTNGYVTYPNTCPINYIPVPVPTPTQNQTCYDGSIISAFSVCPSSFQVCPDGSMISRYSVCPIRYQPPVVRPPMVVNNVITSIPTQITNTSARCNGIGLIGNNLSSVAWFEYGSTQNLGSKTAVANIGSAETSPFTNLLTGLHPNTNYYCRAVMANDLGIIKGDIVSFTTKRIAVYYPTTIVKKATHVVKKKVIVKKEIICSDGSAIETSNESSNTVNISNSALSMLEEGKKAMSLTIVKTKGDVAPNQIVTYFVEFKNESTTNLTDVTVTVSLPAEMTLLKSNTGVYDTRTHEIVVAYPVLAPGQSSTLEIEVGVAKEAIIGKSVAVQVHSTYSIPPMTQKGKVLKDEVVAYAVATIVSAPLHDNAVVPVKEKKETPKATSVNSFLPNTVIEWVALFAILLIIIILVRSIRESYKGDTVHH